MLLLAHGFSYILAHLKIHTNYTIQSKCKKSFKVVDAHLFESTERMHENVFCVEYESISSKMFHFEWWKINGNVMEKQKTLWSESSRNHHFEQYLFFSLFEQIKPWIASGISKTHTCKFDVYERRRENEMSAQCIPESNIYQFFFHLNSW